MESDKTFESPIFQRKTLELQVFKVAVLICIVTSILLFMRDVFIDKDYISGIIEFIALSLCVLVFFVSRKEVSNRVINVFIPVLFLLLNLGWYFGAGLNSTIVLLYLSVVSLSIIVVERKHRTKLVIGYFINITLLIIYEFYNPEFRVHRGNSTGELIATDTSIAITFFMGVSLLRFIRRKFESAREVSIDKNRQLEKQALELKELNEELSAMNNNLEEMAAQRTHQINIQNRKLLEYAYLNSNSVKIYMSSLKRSAANNSPDSIHQILTSCQLLDQELRNINDQLKEDS